MTQTTRAGAGAGGRAGGRVGGRVADFARRRPVLAGALAGGTVLVGGSLLLGGRDEAPSNGDPYGPGGGAGAGDGGGGGGGAGPNFATDPFVGNITAGIGSMFDRLGGGIADLLTALGIPIGEGAGKAIAIGGTAVLIAIALAKGVPALTAASKSGKKAKAGAKAKGAGKASAKPKAGGRKTPTRGPGGKFVKAGGA